MPDQHEASTEHALIQEIAEPLSKLPDDPLPIAADVEFPAARRGYDRIAVDAYVKRTARLVAELQATRSPEAAVRRALERVGEEVSGILQRAHDAAEQITSRSRAEAEERLERSRIEAHEITAGAKQQVTDLDAETDAIWAERRRIVADVNMLASQLTELAQSSLERFPAEETVEQPSPVAGGPEPFPVAAPPEPAAEPAAEESPPTQPFDLESAQAAAGHGDGELAAEGGEPLQDSDTDAVQPADHG
jgi:ribosomal 50S subunit-associated protein YjgA (DUF615 family)